MKTFEIKGTVRPGLGKKESKTLRKSKFIPCVLYGGKEQVHFSAFENDFLGLVYTPHVYIVNVDLGGKVHKAIMKEIQFHPVTDKILHIDFVEVFDDKKVTIGVPVKLNGFAIGVKDGGKLNLERRKVIVSALPQFLPDIIELNVENLALGKTIKVSDIQLENITMLDPKNTVVASVKLTRAAKGMEAETTEAAPVAEGTEAAPAAETK